MDARHYSRAYTVVRMPVNKIENLLERYNFPNNDFQIFFFVPSFLTR